MNRIAGSVLCIRLDTSRPVRHIYEDTAYRNGVRARIDSPCDVLPIPVHHDRDVSPLGGGRTPVTGPCTRQRVSLLRDSRHNCAETQEKETQTEDSPPHAPS